VGCGENTYPCTRGDVNIAAFRWAFFHAELWTVLVFNAVTMLMIYLSILQRERAVDKYRITLREEQKRLLSRRFAAQAFLYIAAYTLVWLFPMIQWVISENSGPVYYPILAITVVVNPLQGFFNAAIYIRPRYIKYRQRLQETGSSSWNAIVFAVSAKEDNDEGAEEEILANDGELEASTAGCTRDPESEESGKQDTEGSKA